MNPIVRNIIAVVLGVVFGSIVNIGLVSLGPVIFPIPGGADITTPEGLEATMHLFKPVNFIFPYLAHALGTLVGAYIAAKIGASRKMILAFLIGIFFLIGGGYMISMIGGPSWFNTLDLLSYLPMAYLGGRLALGKRSQH